ncbi:MAG: hypothetical protein JXA20_00995 [Spirochaetes bacterium]|nr:hypothetical protein [Spirochaetota bacterium]
MAALERRGLLRCCITQKVDWFHGRFGSRNVIELRGNLERLECLTCGSGYGR